MRWRALGALRGQRVKREDGSANNGKEKGNRERRAGEDLLAGSRRPLALELSPSLLTSPPFLPLFAYLSYLSFSFPLLCFFFLFSRIPPPVCSLLLLWRGLPFAFVLTGLVPSSPEPWGGLLFLDGLSKGSSARRFCKVPFSAKLQVSCRGD